MSGTQNSKAKSSKYAEIAQAANAHKGVQDVLESDDDDETPGPGAHWNPGMSSFKPHVKPRRFQNFGSTVVDRFSDKYAVGMVKGQDNIGPGSYHHEQKA